MKNGLPSAASASSGAGDAGGFFDPGEQRGDELVAALARQDVEIDPAVVGCSAPRTPVVRAARDERRTAGGWAGRNWPARDVRGSRASRHRPNAGRRAAAPASQRPSARPRRNRAAAWNAPVAQLPGVAGDADVAAASALKSRPNSWPSSALCSRAALAEGRPQHLLERDAHLVAGVAVADAEAGPKGRASARKAGPDPADGSAAMQPGRPRFASFQPLLEFGEQTGSCPGPGRRRRHGDQATFARDRIERLQQMLQFVVTTDEARHQSLDTAPRIVAERRRQGASDQPGAGIAVTSWPLIGLAAPCGSRLEQPAHLGIGVVMADAQWQLPATKAVCSMRSAATWTVMPRILRPHPRGRRQSSTGPVWMPTPGGRSLRGRWLGTHVVGFGQHGRAGAEPQARHRPRAARRRRRPPGCCRRRTAGRDRDGADDRGEALQRVVEESAGASSGSSSRTNVQPSRRHPANRTVTCRRRGSSVAPSSGELILQGR